MLLDEYLASYRSNSTGLLNAIQATYWSNRADIFKSELITNSNWGLYLYFTEQYSELKSHLGLMEAFINSGKFQFDGGDLQDSTPASVHYSTFLQLLYLSQNKVSVEKKFISDVERYLKKKFFKGDRLKSNVLNQYSRFIEAKLCHGSNITTSEKKTLLKEYKILIKKCYKKLDQSYIICQSQHDYSSYHFYNIKCLPGLQLAYQHTNDAVFLDTIKLIITQLDNANSFRYRHSVWSKILKKIKLPIKHLNENRIFEEKMDFFQRYFTGLNVYEQYGGIRKNYTRIRHERRNINFETRTTLDLHNPRWLSSRLLYEAQYAAPSHWNFVQSENIDETDKRIIFYGTVLEKNT